MRTFGLLFIIVALTATAAHAEFEAVTITNAGLSRIVSGVINILKTSDVKVGDVGLLDQPTMEFMIELDYKGEKVILVPSDFDIKSVERTSENKEDTMGVELRSHYEGLPLTVYIDYTRIPGAVYQQKSMAIPPCREAKGAVLRRVTVEAFRFKKNVQALSVSESGFGSEPKQAFGFIEPKSGKGVCFDWPSGVKAISTNRTLSAISEIEAPVEQGWKSGRLGLCAISGTPEAAYKTYSQFLIDTRCPTLAKNPKLGALEKRFAACFAASQYLPTDGQVSASGYIAQNKGFIVLLNSGDAAKTTISLAASKLALTGDLKLTDWTSLDKPTDIGTKTAADKIELEIDAHSYRIIGVNVE